MGLFVTLFDQVNRDLNKVAAGSVQLTQSKFWVNRALQHIRGEARWQPLYRKFTVDTVGKYTTGSVDVTNGSKTVTGNSSLWITGGIKPGQRMIANDDTQGRVIASIDAEGTITLVTAYGGTTASAADYTIQGVEEYRFPIQWGEIGLIWHEAFGYPFTLENVSDEMFYGHGFDLNVSDTPEFYRKWGESGAEAQPISASAIRVVSSATSGDDTQTIRIQGIVSGVPDFEDITLNNDTAASGSKSFTRVDRIAKSGSTTGRITVDSNSGNVTIAAFPAGNIYSGLSFFLFQLWPIPNAAITLNIETLLRVFDLVDDNDIHPFGPEFDEAIVLYADYLGCLQASVTSPQATTAANSFLTAYRRNIINLKDLFARNPDRVFAMQGRGAPETSRLRRRDFLSFGPGFPKTWK